MSYSDYGFGVRIHCSVDDDDLLIRLIDEIETAGWLCGGGGTPDRIEWFVFGDRSEITPRGRDSFCRWAVRLDGVKMVEATSVVPSSRQAELDYRHRYVESVQKET